MSTEAFTAPDVEACVVAWLRSDIYLTGLVGLHIATELPANPAFPLIQVVRVGGTVVHRGWAYRAMVDVHGYGTTKTQARDAAAEAQRSMALFSGIVRDAVINSCALITDLRWLPDTAFNPHQPRYLFTTTVTYHPLNT